MRQVNAPYVIRVEQAGSRTLTAAGVREESRIEYNTERTHNSLGDRTHEEGLSLRQRRGRRRYRGVRIVLRAPTRMNQRWSMDFMIDALADGRRFRVLNVVDDFSRDCLAAESGRSLTGRHVAAILKRLVEERGAPEAILSDNGPRGLQSCSRRLGASSPRAATLHPAR